MTAAAFPADRARSAPERLAKLFAPRRLLLLVPIVFLAVFFVLPLLQMLAFSAYQYDSIHIVGKNLTLENYLAIVTQPYQQGVLLRTVWLALATTGLSCVLAFPIAIQMRRAQGVGKLVLALIVLSPIMISPIVLVFPWLILLAPNSGLIASAFKSLGLAPPRLMFTHTGVLIGLLYSSLSFMVLSLHTALENIDESLTHAAAVHGASPTQTFFKVTLPLSLPGLAAGSLLVFSVSASSFMMPFMLGGNQVPVLATYAFNMATVLLNWPSASAIGAVLLFVTLIAMFTYNAWIGRLERRLGIPRG